MKKMLKPNSTINDRFMANFFKSKEAKENKSLKDWEYLIQNWIEDAIDEEDKKTRPCWWQHTKVDIFTDLLTNKDVSATIIKVYKDLQ